MNFATLYHGSAGDAADTLEVPDDGRTRPETTVAELRAALINALRRIEYLESRVLLQSLQSSPSKAEGEV